MDISFYVGDVPEEGKNAKSKYRNQSSSNKNLSPAVPKVLVPAASQHGHGATGQAQPMQRKLSGRYALSDFSIERTLGTGSFGRVHLVRSRHNTRFYAIKVSTPVGF